MAAAPPIPVQFLSSTLDSCRPVAPPCARVFRGRELTRKHSRLSSGIPQLDILLFGGIVRGRISELIGPIGAGKTSLAMAFAAQATRTQAAGWIDLDGSFDPASALAVGVRPDCLLWISCARPTASRAISIDDEDDGAKKRRRQTAIAGLKAAEWILAAGGFGLLIIDFGSSVRFIPQSSALRLARAAERSGAPILVLAQTRLCGTFAALSLNLHRRRTYFNRASSGAPATFDGQMLEARVLRNKLGAAGASAIWSAAAESGSVPEVNAANHFDQRFRYATG